MLRLSATFISVRRSEKLSAPVPHWRNPLPYKETKEAIVFRGKNIESPFPSAIGMVLLLCHSLAYGFSCQTGDADPSKTDLKFCFYSRNVADMLDTMEYSVLAVVQIKQQTAQQDLQMPLSCNSTDCPFCLPPATKSL